MAAPRAEYPSWSRALPLRLSGLRLPAHLAAAGVTAMLLACFGLTWWLGGTGHVAPHYFYLPIVLAASRFGYGGGLTAGVAAGALAAIVPADTASGAMDRWSDGLSRTVFFVVVGVIVAGVIGRRTRHLQEQLAAVQVENDLRRAVARGELRLHYQPVIGLADGAAVGVEALLRWQHPRRGLLGPAEFIGVAEQSDLIRDIGAWVLAEACRQAAQWQEEAPGGRVHVGVNVSAQQLSDPSLGDIVRRALEASGLPPHALILEVTETALIGDLDESATRLRALQALGVQIAVDDYGTGYASLVYLQRLPIDIIKVDRAFVAGMAQDPRDFAIVESVLLLARQLAKQAIAEGVESPEQAESLRGLGCDAAQGFLFSRPVPPAECVAALRATWVGAELVG